MEKLYKFHWSCGRQGDIEGMFVEDSRIIEASIGLNVYFGEVLGKHSDISGVIEKGDYTEISENPAVLKIFEKHIGGTGFNPISLLLEDEEEDEEEVREFFRLVSEVRNKPNLETSLVMVSLPSNDPVLSDFLEDCGYLEAANALRGVKVE